jgi:uncharacterized membrane protein
MFLFTDLFKMISDIRKKNRMLGFWGQALNFPMFFAPAFFFDRITVWIVFSCNLLAVIIAAQIHKKSPFSRMTSICHIAWIPMLIALVQEHLRNLDATGYRAWLFYVSATVLISLVLDGFNLVKLALGDRSEIG